MYEEARAHGLRAGVTLPIHGPNQEAGMMCFVNDANPTDTFWRHIDVVLPNLVLLRDLVIDNQPAPSAYAHADAVAEADAARTRVSSMDRARQIHVGNFAYPELLGSRGELPHEKYQDETRREFAARGQP